VKFKTKNGFIEKESNIFDFLSPLSKACVGERELLYL